MSLDMSVPYLLADLLLALLAFLSGAVCVLLYRKSEMSAGHATSESDETATQSGWENKMRTERADMAVLQLRDLTRNVALDVGSHNRLVTGISDRLGSMRGESINLAEVTEAVADIISANSQLQVRLESAERKIESQQEELRAHQTEARTDSLTKLANRRELDATIDRLVAQCRQNRPRFSVLLFDIDHFKQFNDEHGHLAGDAVLRAVARAFRKAAKSTDLPCRFGGEEFALIMPHTPIAQARLAAERVRSAIEQTQVKFDGKSFSVTASVGVAEFAADDDYNQILQKADESVYAAKTAGRNRSFWHNGEQPQLVDPDAPCDATFTRTTSANSRAAEAYLSLPNWELFSTELGRRVAESHRFGLPLTVMYLKVDDYAKLEVEYGDAVGEMLLDSVTRSIGSTLREMDLLGRLGVGEFVVMLPGSSVKEASLVGARVQASISSCVFPAGLHKLDFTVHQGITGIDPKDDSNSLIQRAKELLNEEIELPI